MQEEVIALKQPHTESAACLGLPRLKLLGDDQQVLLAAKGGDGTVQGWLRSVRVGLAQLEVRAHDRDEHLHQFGMLQDTLWCATDTREHVDDPGVGQWMKTCEGRFPHATLASRQKYRADLNCLGQFIGPETKERCSASSVRQAEQA